MTFLYYASDAFASRAKVLTDSIKLYHPESEIVHINPGNYPIGSYIPGMAKARLEKALEILEEGDSVCIIGADCQLINRMRELTDIIFPEDIIIVPHIVTPSENRDYMAQLYRTGHANADLMVFQNTGNSINCLKWLISVTEGEDKINGIFYEQTWLSSVPFLFPKVQVLRNWGYNLGYWTDEKNISSHNITMIQYSGYEKGNPKKMSKHSNKETPEILLPYFKNYDERI